MHKIAVIPGDGTGPEVVVEGLKVLEAAAEATRFNFEVEQFDWGGDRYLATGEVLPEGATEELRGFKAIFLGAIGHPDVKPGILEQGILLKLRFELDQYINLRPVKLYPGVDCPLKDKGPDDIDLVVVRKGEKVHVGVPIHVVGEAAVDTVVALENNTVELAVEATHIPERLEVSVAGLTAGTRIHASDLVLPKGAELVTEADILIVNITQAITAEELEAELAADVAANLTDEAIAAAEAEAAVASAEAETPEADADKVDKA